MINLDHKIAGVVSSYTETQSSVLKMIKGNNMSVITAVTVTTATKLNVTGTDKNGSAVNKDYTWASYTTMGALVDAINADGYLLATVFDCLRSEATGASKFVENTALVANADGSYDVHGNGLAAGFGAIYYRLAADRTLPFTDPTVSRVHLQELVAFLDVTGTGTMEVYSSKKNIETKILTISNIADATLTTKNWASGQGILSSDWGADLVVKLYGTTVTTNASNLLSVCGFIEKQ